MIIRPEMRRSTKSSLREIEACVKELRALVNRESLTGPEQNYAADLVGAILGESSIVAESLHLEV